MSKDEILNTSSFLPNMNSVFKFTVKGKIIDEEIRKIQYSIQYDQKLDEENRFSVDAFEKKYIEPLNDYSNITYSVYDIYEYGKNNFNTKTTVDNIQYEYKPVIQIDEVNGIDHPSFTLCDAEYKWFKFTPKVSKEYNLLVYGNTSSHIDINIFNKQSLGYSKEGLLFKGSGVFKDLNDSALSGTITPYYLESGIDYYFRINEKDFRCVNRNNSSNNAEFNVNASLTFEIFDYRKSNREHNCVFDRYEWLDYEKHYSVCKCGKRDIKSAHIVSSRGLKVNNFPQYKKCLRCHGPAKIGFIIDRSNEKIDVTKIINIKYYTDNGSFIFDNGIVVLSDIDIPKYNKGTLVFKEKIV